MLSTRSKTWLGQGYHIEEASFSERLCGDLVRLALERLRADNKPWMQPHREQPVFRTMLMDPHIVQLAEEFCGGRVSGLQTTWYYGAPGTPGWVDHQDNCLVHAPRDAFVAVWCPMVDVTPEMGGLHLYPGTHRMPLLPTEKYGEEVGPDQDENARWGVVLPVGHASLGLVLRAGSAVFMHGHLVHRSGVNLTDHWRHALLMTYIRQGSPFRAGDTAKRSAVEVYGGTSPEEGA